MNAELHLGRGVRSQRSAASRRARGRQKKLESSAQRPNEKKWYQREREGKKTHSRSPSTLSPRGCRAFQSTRLHNIHSSNQFYQRNQYGWNIGLLWLVTFSWGLCEQGNVFTMIRLKQPGHWEGWSSDAAIIIIIITKTPFLWLTFGPYFQRVRFRLVAAQPR